MIRSTIVRFENGNACHGLTSIPFCLENRFTALEEAVFVLAHFQLGLD